MDQITLLMQKKQALYSLLAKKAKEHARLINIPDVPAEQIDMKLRDIKFIRSRYNATVKQLNRYLK